MAKGGAVWGIDIGQCALKALRCRPHEKEPRRLVVESFDYIEYPKILTQPEAEPAELIREALETFLSRNELVGDTRRDVGRRPERPDAVHQAAAGRSEEDPRHRQVRSPAADSVLARRRRLGLPAAHRRQRRRWLRAGAGSRPVRDEARSGRPRARRRSKRPASKSTSSSSRRCRSTTTSASIGSKR